MKNLKLSAVACIILMLAIGQLLAQYPDVVFRTCDLSIPDTLWCPILDENGDPLQVGDYIGFYLAGANGVPDPPGPYGEPTNDDIQPTGNNINHYLMQVEAAGYFPLGNLYQHDFLIIHPYGSGTEPCVNMGDPMYLRAFNAPDPSIATYYNDLVTVDGDSASTYTCISTGPHVVIVCFSEAIQLGPFALHPDITVSPEALDFGDVWAGQLAQLPLTIYNVGDTTLVLYDIYSSLTYFSNSWDPPDSLISVGDSLEITVYFAPDDSAVYNDTLVIDSNDPDGLIAVPLTGVGIEDFRITSPNGGEEWGVFQQHIVQWVSGGYQGLVTIDLNRDYPSGTWELLADSTANDSAESVFITDPLSDNCRIRISAVDSSLSDISDDDFSIVSSQGYLAMITLDQPSIPLVAWDAGFVECNGSSSRTFHLKNFGNESIVVFNPESPVGPHFTSSNSCPSYFALAPDEVSTCSLTITYQPSGATIDYDSLRIMTDAANAQNGYVRIPLSGQQITTPAVPQITISIEGDDARLIWNPITESVLGCSIDVTYYLIFYSEIQTGPYFYLGYTPDTTYVHYGAPRFTDTMFYQALACTDPFDELDKIFIPGILITREEVLATLKQN